jgi:hypothetical protein
MQQLKNSQGLFLKFLGIVERMVAEDAGPVGKQGIVKTMGICYAHS